MNIDTLHGFELELIRGLQYIRSPWLDRFMTGLNIFDSLPFYIVAIACVWYLCDRTCGLQLVFVLVISEILNLDLKEIFCLPRPFQIDPNVGLIRTLDFGFPSGPAQSLTAVFGFLALTLHKRLVWIFSLCLALLVSFSRVYLGLYFPSDIIGGWIIGIALVGCSYLVLPFVGRVLCKQPKISLLYLSVIFALLLSCLSLNEKALWNVFFGFGVSIGFLVARPVPLPSTFVQRILRLSIAFLSIGGASLSLSFVFSFFGFTGMLSVFVHLVWMFFCGLCLSIW